METGVKVQSQVIRITAEANLEPESTEEPMFSRVHLLSMVHFTQSIKDTNCWSVVIEYSTIM